MPDEPNAGGQLFDPNAFGPAGSPKKSGKSVTGTATASLKFDIRGLTTFKDELKKVDEALRSLDATFKRLKSAPKEYAQQLEAVNKQLREMKTYGKLQPGGVGGTGGPTGIDVGGGGGGGGGGGLPVPNNLGSLITQFGGRSGQGGLLSKLGGFANVLGKGGGSAMAEGAGMAGMAEGGMMAGGGGAAAAAGGPAGVAAMAGMAVSAMAEKAVQAVFKRFDEGMDKTIQMDTYFSRRSLATGMKSHELMTVAGNKGYGFGPNNIPFLPSDPIEAAAMMERGQHTVGGFYQAPGLAGQKGQAYIQSMGQQQAINGGLTPAEAAGRMESRVNNIQGGNAALAMFGPKVSMYKKGGDLKTDQEYYRDIMSVIVNLPRGPGGHPGQKWTKAEIMSFSRPGSPTRNNLALMGMTPEDMEGFFAWALANASVGGNLSDIPGEARKQIEKQTGQRLSTETQVTQAGKATRDTAFGAEQYGTMLTRQELEQQITRLLDGLDSWLQGLYNVTGNVPGPLQGIVSKAAGFVLSPGGTILNTLLGGDPGYMGDPEGSLSHLTPDLRKRVGAMMGDNPNLRINSAYRDNVRQERLQGKGPFAPSGKSKHGQGQALDLGPANQHGWLAKNARKYGLDTAGNMGEPWHVQLSGTMGFMGDIGYNPSMNRTSMAARANEDRMSSKWNELQSMSFMAKIQLAAAQLSGGSGVVGSDGVAADSATGGSADTTGLAGKKDKMTMEEVAKVAYAAGFRGEDLVTMVAIAFRESGGNPSSWVENKTDVGGGLWAINQLPWLNKGMKPPWTKEEILDPVRNAQIAFEMFQQRQFNPWNMPGSLNAYKDQYPKHLGGTTVNNAWSKIPAARAAVKAAGLGDAGYVTDAVDYGTQSAQVASAQSSPLATSAARASMAVFSGGGGGSRPVMFNNTFNITMSGGSRADVDVGNTSDRYPAGDSDQPNRVKEKLTVPDHGERLPPYLSGALPVGILGMQAYGWSGMPPYKPENLPSNIYFTDDKFAYERIDWENFQKIGAQLFGGKAPLMGTLSNPNFLGAGQMLGASGPPDWMRGKDGKVKRILRGFIRRDEMDPTQKESYVRLNFMWNPDEIRRMYRASYNASSVYDVTNQIDTSSNEESTAIGQVEATFTLYFDRQLEVAAITDHPGVLVDLQTFDVLAGNQVRAGTAGYVAPTGLSGYISGWFKSVESALVDAAAGAADPAGAEAAAQAEAASTTGVSGVWMKSMKVAVVFSPNLTFYGVLVGAEAAFTKFSHRMTPTAMTLTLTILMNQIGSLTRPSISSGDAPASGMVPAGSVQPKTYDPRAGANPKTTEEVRIANVAGNLAFRDWCYNHQPSAYTYTNRMDGPPCNDRTMQSDCSSFLYRGLLAIGWSKMLGLGDSCSYAPDTSAFEAKVRSRNDVWDTVPIKKGVLNAAWQQDLLSKCQPGDIFIRGRTNTGLHSNGHIVMFAGTVGGAPAKLAEANCYMLHSHGGSNKRASQDTVRGINFMNYNVWAHARPFRATASLPVASSGGTRTVV